MNNASVLEMENTRINNDVILHSIQKHSQFQIHGFRLALISSVFTNPQFTTDWTMAFQMNNSEPMGWIVFLTHLHLILVPQRCPQSTTKLIFNFNKNKKRRQSYFSTRLLFFFLRTIDSINEFIRGKKTPYAWLGCNSDTFFLFEPKEWTKSSAVQQLYMLLVMIEYQNMIASIFVARKNNKKKSNEPFLIHLSMF